ncbi:MAG: hypothetical protein R3C17_21375 [Planctomycetaceae bacterium]
MGAAPNDTDFANARIEFFVSDGSGEGKTYLGFLTTDANGNFSGVLAVSGVVDTDSIVATATMTGIGSSEFGNEYGVNVAPVISVPVAQSTQEDTSLSIGGLYVSDADTNVTSVQVSTGNGSLTVTLQGAASISAGTNGTSTLTISGTQTDINSTLATLSYLGNADWNGTDTVNVLATDSDGMTHTNSFDVSVAAVNDTPVVTAPVAAFSFTEQGSLNIHGTGFSMADVDDNGGTMTATFAVGEGRILIDAGDSGVSVTSGAFNTSGNSTDTVTFTGTKSQINALLSGSSTGTIVYYHDQTAGSDAPSASTTITLTVNDQGNTGSDPGLTADATSEEHFASQTINITSVNDAPEFIGPNLITNGTFDTNLTGWSTTGTVTAGSGRATFGTGGNAGPHTLSQTIATNVGDVYVLEFDYRDGHAALNQQLQVTVDGSSNLLTSEQILTDTDGSSFVRYRFEFVADSTSSTLTFTDTSDDAGSLSATTNGVDSAVDNITVRQVNGQIGTSYTEDGSTVVLDSDVTLFDAEINATLDNFDGTTLTLVRNGGANGDDVFSHWEPGAQRRNAGTLVNQYRHLYQRRWPSFRSPSARQRPARKST